MFRDILDLNQQKLLPLIKSFSPDYYLVGGTAIALYIGHRRSLDFDLFTDQSFDPLRLRRKILGSHKINQTFSQGEGELTVLVNNVRITFFHYPFLIKRPVKFENLIYLPKLITLGAMKAFSLGRRAKWKDYVDLYFILQKHSFKELIGEAYSIFRNQFNEKLFRTQLSYFEDIDYSEAIQFMPGFEKKDKEIKEFLEKVSLSP